MCKCFWWNNTWRVSITQVRCNRRTRKTGPFLTTPGATASGYQMGCWPEQKKPAGLPPPPTPSFGSVLVETKKSQQKIVGTTPWNYKIHLRDGSRPSNFPFKPSSVKRLDITSGHSTGGREDPEPLLPSALRKALTPITHFRPLPLEAQEKSAKCHRYL